VLPIRFRWAWAEEKKNHLVLTGKNLLSAAGIPYDPRRPGETWEKLERNLEELRRIQGLGRWEWDVGAKNTLSGLCRLYPAAWQLDRTLHGLKPPELPPGPSVLTGDELKAWRKAKGWTQAEAAHQLGVSQFTISVSEAKKAGTISDALALKVRALK
jgi:DNA-binding XRE family transcriptional regulator